MTKLPSIAVRDKSLAHISPLQLYMQEVAKYPLLTPSEEYELAVKHFDDGDVNAAHRLVTSNLRLVVKIANDFKQAQSGLLDLIQEGNYGLMQAVKRFNPYRGVKLSTYAAWWIKAFILKYIMENKSQVKIGTTAAQRKLFFNLRKEAERLLAEYDRIDTKLLAESLDVREKDVTEMQQRLSGSDVSLDGPINGEEGAASRITMLEDSQAETAEDALASEQVRRIFAEHLVEYRKSLKGRDAEVFDGRIMSDTPMTLQEVGDRYGISRERARQIENRIIQNLRKFVEEKGLLIDV